MQIDREFSARSAEAGMKIAFFEYADDSMVILRPNAMPLAGKLAMEQTHKDFSDEGYVLTKKQSNGSWKFILDTGNEGLE